MVNTPWYAFRIGQGYTIGHGGYHDGYDFETPKGTPHTSLFGGTVTSHTGWYPWGGETDIKNPITGITETFAHEDRIDVKPGQVVWPGQQVVISGGENLPRKYSTGEHTHYSLFGGAPWDNRYSIDPKNAVDSAIKNFGVGSAGDAFGGDVGGALNNLSTTLGEAIGKGVTQIQEGVTTALHRIAFFTIGLAVILLGALILLWPAIQSAGRGAVKAAVTAAKIAVP
jgi:murein DD-endopeptidase MepM/ murein hydrolase activator NlpD